MRCTTARKDQSLDQSRELLEQLGCQQSDCITNFSILFNNDSNNNHYLLALLTTTKKNAHI